MERNRLVFKDPEAVRIGDRVRIESYKFNCDAEVLDMAWATDDHSVRIKVRLDPKGLRRWHRTVWVAPYEILVFRRRAQLFAMPPKESA